MPRQVRFFRPQTNVSKSLYAENLASHLLVLLLGSICVARRLVKAHHHHFHNYMKSALQ